MAKKSKTTTSTSNYSLVKVCAFVGVIVAGFAGLLSFMFSLLAKCGVKITWSGKVVGACSIVSQVALFVCAWLAAWDYAKYKGRVYRTLFWVFFVLSILGLVGLGMSSWL